MTLQEHFDKKADIYYEHVYLSGKRNHHVHNQQVRRDYFRKLIRAHQCHQSSLALDIGSGPGTIAQDLIACGFTTHASDISFQMLLNNRKRNVAVKLAQSSGNALCYEDNTFDIVTAAGVLEYIQDDDGALREMLRVLKPGGTLIISAPIKEWGLSSYLRNQIGRLLFKRESNSIYHKGYTPTGFEQALKKAGFTLRTRISHHFVFFPLDYLFPRLSIQMDLLLTSLLEKNALFAGLGTTYIVDAAKPESAESKDVV